MLVAYVRTVKTASGATAVQIVHSNRRGSREIEHIGSAHTPAEVEVLKTVARQRLHANQDTLDLDDGRLGDDEAPIVSSRARHLWEVLGTAYQVLGLDQACGGDEVFKLLTLARVIEPTSKLDSIRVLTEVGIAAPSYPTIKRRLPVYATPEWRDALASACAAHVGLGPATLVLYDVTTLYFETDEGDGFREPGFSKERRLEPQITVGLLTDVRGFPLQVHAFDGNTAETKTILPVIQAFAAAHGLPEVTVVADAGMLSEANLAAIEDAGLRFIVGARIPDVPYQVSEWRRTHPGEPIGDGQIFVQPWVMGTQDRSTQADDLLPVPRGPGQADVEGHRSADRQGREGGGRAGGGEAEPVRPAHRCDEDDQPEPGGQSPRPGRVEGLRHQPRSADRGVRAGCLPPAVADREELPDVQDRSTSPADLPPQTRLHRGPPHHRDGRPRRQPLARTPDRLVDQETREDPAPLPQHRRPDRRPHPPRRNTPRR